MSQHLSRLEPGLLLRGLLIAESFAPRRLVERGRNWIRALRRRRAALRIVVGAQVLVALWWVTGGRAAGSGSAAAAQPGSMSAIDGLAWMDVRDSSGIPVSDYLFVTDSGGALDPMSTALSLVLGLEFMVFLVIVISAIWSAAFVLSFGWLDWLGKPFGFVAERTTDHVATPILMTTAAALGAFFVAWFIIRGYHAKAVLQILSMVAVALFGAFYLADPMADVLSSEGLLVQGRDVGIAVAAGLNGNSTPDAGAIVETMNGTLADNFVRHPLQVWNFGHVVDGSPRCRAAWSAGVRAGNEAQVAQGMRMCGDAYAYAKTQDPSMGQIGTGIVLLLFGTVLSLFLSFLSIKVFLAALSSIFHAILAIFGFAAGGFIYGPTQTLLIRNLVHMVGDAIAMVSFTIFLGGYVLVLDSVFRAAPQGGMAVIFVGGMLLISSFVLLRRLDNTILGHQNQVIGQIVSTLATGRSAGAGAAGGSSGMGMAEAGLRHSLTPGGVASAVFGGLATFGMLSANPVTSWLFRRPNPFMHFAKEMQEMNYLNYMLLLGEVPERTHASWMGRLTLGKNAHDDAARAAATEYGHNHRGAAAAITSVLGLGGDLGDAAGALLVAGFSRSMTAESMMASMRVTKAAEDHKAVYGPLARAAAAASLANNAREASSPRMAPGMRSAYIGELAESSALYEFLAPRPFNPVDKNPILDQLKPYWDKPFDEFKAHLPSDLWEKANEDHRLHAGATMARNLNSAAQQYLRTNDERDLAEVLKMKNRAQHVDMLLAGMNIGPHTN
ncbi:hypothetical protein ACFVMC_29075 [Nocardia sp. NPDC127579]|uniref:hypothetical protein n=1 Tax=Nocardia sp. NPDC127579 TaxID=3345402 RepID=UPI0036297155